LQGRWAVRLLWAWEKEKEKEKERRARPGEKQRRGLGPTWAAVGRRKIEKKRRGAAPAEKMAHEA
jgi:hypothetical protein